jgi:hypothetical protein
MPIILLFIIGIAFWALFIKGLFWKLIVAVFGWIGMYACMCVYNFDKNVLVSIGDSHFSTAAVVPTIIVALAMMTTSIED